MTGKDGLSLEPAERKNVRWLEPSEQTRRILERFAVTRGMTIGSKEFYGDLHSIIVRREKLIELLIPSGPMVVVSAEAEFPWSGHWNLKAWLQDSRRAGPRE